MRYGFHLWARSPQAPSTTKQNCKHGHKHVHADTHRANSSHLHLTHNCWLRLALASAETLQSNILHESLLWTGIKQNKNHLKSRWFISERPRYDSVTLGYNLHTRHKFECFGNKRQIRTLLATPPPQIFCFIGGRSLSLAALTHLHGDQFVHRSIKDMHMLKQTKTHTIKYDHTTQATSKVDTLKHSNRCYDEVW